MTSEPSSFGAALLASIHTGASPLQIAHDPDGMLLDEDALARLGERGFAVLRWRDEVTFRFEYETRFRSVWDRGEQARCGALQPPEHGILHRVADVPLLRHRIDQQPDAAATNLVRTASVWQVRQPLHQRSSGRWRHYEGHIADLAAEIDRIDAEFAR